MGRYLGHDLKDLQDSLYINCCGISLPRLPLQQFCQLCRPQKTWKRILMTLNQQKEEINKRNTPELYRPSTGAETKNYVQELRSL